MNTADYLLSGGSPDDPVLIDAAGEHSYAELRSAVAALTTLLTGARLPPHSPIGLFAPNGLFWVASYVAALARGLVVAPLPTTLPLEEVVARTTWLGARAILVGRQQARRIEHLLPPDVAVLGEDSVSAPSLTGVEIPPSIDVEPDRDAVYEFTSGTTGSPRVVRITHRNIQANTDSILAYLRLARDDRTLVVLPFTYVFGASLLHTHLRAGASMVIQPNFVFPESIVERMLDERCTGFAGVPSTFHLLLRNSSFRSRPIPSLRLIQQAGGKLPPVLIRELVAAQPQAKVFVMYGQTEATARLSYLPPEEVLTRIGSVGRGIPGVELRVVDTDDHPVAAGEVGEIRARGANISPGYLNNPAATAEKMPGGDLHTGDLARIDEDGYIYIVDRAEDFIKSWGYRIASQDIEAVVMQLPDLVSAAVVGVADLTAGERIELVVVRRPGSAIGLAEVLAECHRQLPKHMIPAVVHFIDQLPLNPNGKVSKRELRSLCERLAQPTPGEGRDG